MVGCTSSTERLGEGERAELERREEMERQKKAEIHRTEETRPLKTEYCRVLNDSNIIAALLSFQQAFHSSGLGDSDVHFPSPCLQTFPQKPAGKPFRPHDDHRRHPCQSTLIGELTITILSIARQFQAP
jgi:hypothetical protein